MKTQDRAIVGLANAGPDRFHYRPLCEYVFKHTPQTDLQISVHFPFDWTAADRRPGILFFFGSGFRLGSREQFTRQATYLASRGMVAARADYRLHNLHGATVDQCAEDALSAMRWFRGHAAELGLDPGRIVAAGGSSGGSLALSLATLQGLDAPAEDPTISTLPQALVLFSPGLIRLPVGELVPNEEVARRIAGILDVPNAPPPMLIFYGTADRLYPPAIPFMERARARGGRVDLDLAEGGGHGYFNQEPWFSRTLHRADRFLASLGYLEGEPTFAISES